MLRRSRIFVVVNTFLLLIGLLALGNQLPGRVVSADAPIPPAHPTPGKHFGKETRIPLPVYGSMTTELRDTLTALRATDVNPAALFDLDNANYFLNSATKNLTSITVGLCNSDIADITATDSTLPDNPKLSAKVIGAVYEPSVSKTAMVLVYVRGQSPVLRFYSGTSQIFADELKKYEERQFVGVDGATAMLEAPITAKCKPATSSIQTMANRPTQYDEGSIISARETCFTVGLAQECYQYSPSDPNAKDTVSAAYKDLTSANASKVFRGLDNVRFDFDGAVADLMGDEQRTNCAGVSDKPDAFQAVPAECQATVIIAGVNYTSIAAIPSLKGTPYANWQILGLLVVLPKDGIKLDTFNNPDNPKGEIYKKMPDGTLSQAEALPPGEYVWFNMNRNAIPGDGMTKAMVNSQGVEYQVPGYRMEAFGAIAKSSNSPLQAFVKDGGGGGSGCP